MSMTCNNYVGTYRIIFIVVWWYFPSLVQWSENKVSLTLQIIIWYLWTVTHDESSSRFFICLQSRRQMLVSSNTLFTWRDVMVCMKGSSSSLGFSLRVRAAFDSWHADRWSIIKVTSTLSEADQVQTSRPSVFDSDSVICDKVESFVGFKAIKEG